MQKIDLHIHTVSSSQDREFFFSEEKLQQYINEVGLNCIAVTNHNLFDKKQFEHIRATSDIVVLPGIEVDVEKCHLLVIADGNDLADFDTKCAEIQSKWTSSGKSLSFEDFSRIWSDLSQYILIPHYEKNPKISPEVLEKFGDHITSGEVSNPKRFVSCVDDVEKLVPLFFSDCRVDANLNPLPTRQTYIDCDEVSFGTLREVFRDKRKVALTEDEGNRLFQIFSDGQQLSTGLNVILGDRSSGKSHTLQRICDWFGDDNVKYIRQFDLVARNEAEDEQKFKDLLSQSSSVFTKNYLSDLQRVVEDILDVDLKSDLQSVEAYVASLLKYAQETTKHDAFSKAKIYREYPFNNKDLNGLVDLIESTDHLLSNKEYREIIDKHIDVSDIRALYVELMTTYCQQYALNAKRSWVNALVQDVKTKLQTKSSAPNVTDVDLIKVVLNQKKVARFNQIVEEARRPHTPLRQDVRGFEIVAKVRPFSGAGELKEVSRSKKGFSDAFAKYDKPYEFLNELRKIGDPVKAAAYSEYLVKVEYKILNRHGFEASGGERSEFFLLETIQEAEGAEILLIDEPESSFDNHFLKADVNELIKAMSKKMPVVIVTHNNTVGVSIKPDYLICTRKEISGRDVSWRIYSGYPTSKQLISTDGLTLPTRDVLLGNLEAGVEAYEHRGKTYENLKN